MNFWRLLKSCDFSFVNIGVSRLLNLSSERYSCPRCFVILRQSSPMSFTVT